MQVLAPVTLSGSGQSISLGTQGTVGAAVIANESIYALQVIAGGSSRWIPAFTVDLVSFGNTGYTGSITLNLQSYLDYGGAAPSAMAFVTTYAPGETIQGTYPASLTRVTNVGNTVTTTNVSALINDGNAAGTQIIESTATGAPQSNVQVKNDGTLTLFGYQAGTVYGDLLQVIPAAGAVNASVSIMGNAASFDNNGNLNAKVTTATKLVSDANKVTTDGSGNLTAVTINNGTWHTPLTVSVTPPTGVIPSSPTLITGASITISTAGYYLIHGMCNLQFGTTPADFNIYLAQNGTTQNDFPGLNEGTSTTVARASLHWTWALQCANGDTLALYWSGNGTASVASTPAPQAKLIAQWMHP